MKLTLHILYSLAWLALSLLAIATGASCILLAFIFHQAPDTLEVARHTLSLALGLGLVWLGLRLADALIARWSLDTTTHESRA